MDVFPGVVQALLESRLRVKRTTIANTLSLAVLHLPSDRMAVGGVTFKSDDIVIKSPNDCRLYRYIQLENGLCALIVHDPEIYPDGALEPSKAPANTEEEEGEEEADDKEEEEEGEYSEDDEDEEEEDEEGEDDEVEGKEKRKKNASQTKKVIQIKFHFHFVILFLWYMSLKI